MESELIRSAKSGVIGGGTTIGPASRWFSLLRHSVPLVLLAVAFSVTPVYGAGRCDLDRICAVGSPWFDLAYSEVRTRARDSSFSATMTMMLRDDVRVRYHTASQGQPNDGELLLIGGEFLALKGGSIEPGYEIDLIDGPALMLQTVVSLLDFALPEGPAMVKSEKTIASQETKRRVAVATASASAEYGPPWSVAGTLRRESSGLLAFDLTFTFVPLDPLGRDTQQQAQSMHLSGRLDYSTKRAELPNDFSLAGWRVLGLGPQTRKEGQATMLDFGANAKAEAYQTVGEVRAIIKQESAPGSPDPAVDFTGFWKESCEQNFGLQIQHVGANGMYSISFCGPGGCFEPGTYRPNSYINQDRSYQVVSRDEIKVRGAGGWSSYRKCASQPPSAGK